MSFTVVHFRQEKDIGRSPTEMKSNFMFVPVDSVHINAHP